MNSITLVILFYNHKMWVQHIMDDAFLQQNVDIIFSDDASTDGTYEEIQKYLETRSYNGVQRTVNCQRSPTNLGIVRHINTILPQIQTEFVAFVGADDRLAPDFCKVVLKNFTNGVTCVTANQYRIDESGNSIDKSGWSGKNIPSVRDVIANESFGVPSAGSMFRTSAITKFGDIPEELDNDDEQILFRAIIEGKRKVTTEHLFFYRVHSRSLSAWHRDYGMSRSEHLRRGRQEELNRIKNLQCWKKLLGSISLAHDKKNELYDMIDARTRVHEKKLRILAGDSKGVSDLFYLYFVFRLIPFRNALRYLIGRKIRLLRW